MRYRLSIIPSAQKELENLPNTELKRIVPKIEKLSENPRPYGCQKLTNRDGWRVRAGDYRVVYDILDNQQEVVIVHVGHRKDVYRKFDPL